MKNELLLSTLLLTTPVSGSTLSQFNEVIEKSIQDSMQLDGIEFSSKMTKLEIWDYDQGQYVFVDGYIKVKFVSVNDDWLTWEGDNPDEAPNISVQFTKYDSEGKKLDRWNDTEYYAKKIAKSKYRIYDCDSSARCQQDDFHHDFYVFETQQGLLIKTHKKSVNKNGSNYFHVESLLEVKSE